MGQAVQQFSNEEVQIQPVVQVENNNNMTQINVSNTKFNTDVLSAVWNDRRAWVKPDFKPSIKMDKDQILAADPVAFIEKMFTEGRIRLTSTANNTRKEGIPVIFADNVQMDQFGRTIALVENKIHKAWYEQMSDASRRIALMDLIGDHSRTVVEEVDEVSGHIRYSVFYANPAFNNHGDLIGLKKGAANPVMTKIYDSVNGYNKWVDAHNDAIMAVGQGVASPEQKTMAAKSKQNDDPNLFVRNNSVRHINANAVINKYSLEALLILDEQQPAFEIYTGAKSFEAAIHFLEGRLTKITYGYRSQLAMLAGVSMADQES